MMDNPKKDDDKAMEQLGKTIHKFWTEAQRDSTHCPICHEPLFRDPKYPELITCTRCGLAMKLPEQSN